MSVAELKELDDKSLVHRELQLERELMEARFRNKTGQLEDTSKLAKLRKGIARARTLDEQRRRRKCQAAYSAPCSPNKTPRCSHIEPRSSRP